MSNRFSQVTSKNFRKATSAAQGEPSRSKVKPDKERIGREAFDTLMALLAEDSECPTTPYGVLVANSTKRNLRKQIEDLFQP